MTITASVQLPSQPGAGAVEYVPLGGDGMVSPHSVTYAWLSSPSDASAGYNRGNIRFDTRWTQLVETVMVEVWDAAADVNILADITASPACRQGYCINAEFEPVSTLNPEIRANWSPAPQLITAGTDVVTANPQIRAAIVNTDGETLQIYAKIFNFDRQAAQRVPIEILTRCLTRASTII